MAYEEIDQNFSGKWKVDRSENFEAFLQEVGVNALLRKVAPKLSPQMEISVTGGKVKIIMKTGLFTSEDLFSIDEEYMKEIQGIWMKAKPSYEDGKLIIKQSPIDPKSTVKSQIVHREIVGEEMVITMFVGDVVCKRYFKKIS